MPANATEDVAEHSSMLQPSINMHAPQFKPLWSAGPPSEKPGPWAERSRALSYRALLYRAPSYLILTMLTVGPAGPLKVAGPLGICPPCPPPLGGPDDQLLWCPMYYPATHWSGLPTQSNWIYWQIFKISNIFTDKHFFTDIFYVNFLNYSFV